MYYLNIYREMYFFLLFFFFVNDRHVSNKYVSNFLKIIIGNYAQINVSFDYSWDIEFHWRNLLPQAYLRLLIFSSMKFNRRTIKNNLCKMAIIHLPETIAICRIHQLYNEAIYL